MAHAGVPATTHRPMRETRRNHPALVRALGGRAFPLGRNHMSKPLTPLATLLAGADLGLLTLLREAEPIRRNGDGGRVRIGVFGCSCGEVKTLRADNVKRCRTTSCGCVNVELTIARNRERSR